MMKKTLLVLALLVGCSPAFAYETGPADTVLRSPPGGGRMRAGAVDVSKPAAVTGVLRATNGGADSSQLLDNCSITASVASNALTISLKDAGGNDPSSASPCRAGMRSGTATSGAYSIATATSAQSLVISSGSTLGTLSGQPHDLHVHLINNAGALELAVSQVDFDSGTLVSTTAEGGAGAADSNRILYSTTARSNVGARLFARIRITQATAGTWASAPAEVSIWPFEIRQPHAMYTRTTNQTVADLSSDRINFATLVSDSHGAVTTGGSWSFTCPKSGRYGAFVLLRWSANATTYQSTRISVGGSDVVNWQAIGVQNHPEIEYSCSAGSTIHATAFINNGGGSLDILGGADTTFIVIRYLGR
jgi:hypothetical protein